MKITLVNCANQRKNKFPLLALLKEDEKLIVYFVEENKGIALNHEIEYLNKEITNWISCFNAKTWKILDPDESVNISNT